MNQSQYEESVKRMYEARMKEHQRMIHEAVYSPSQNQNQVGDGSASGSAGGNPNSVNTTFYGYGFISPREGNFISIDSEGNQFIIGNRTFNGGVSFCRNTDNGKMYYIHQDLDTDEMVIGYIDVTDGNIVEIDREVLTEKTFNTPASIYYLGEGSFLYLDNSIILGGEGSIQNVYAIDIIDDVVTIGNSGSAIASFDANDTGFFATAMFPYNGQIWGTITGTYYPLGGYAIYDLETSTILDAAPMTIENYPFSNMTKPLFNFGISQSPNGILYSVIYGADLSLSDTFFIIIASLDPENFKCEYIQNTKEHEWFPADIEIA